MIPDPGAAKGEWRRWARAARQAVDWAEVGERVVAHLRSWPDLGGVVLAYLPMAEEVDVTGLAGEVTMVVTRTGDDDNLTIHALSARRERHALGFEQPVAGTPEVDPATVAVALVPGLAFDIFGTRLGRGRGYFDRLLGRLGSTRLVGVAPAALVVEELPSDPHDVRMTHLATEGGVWPVATPPHELPDASRRVVLAGRERGLQVAVRNFPEGTKTSQDAADAIGCEVAQIVKSLVFVVDGEPVVALLPGDRRLDTAKLAAAHGGAAARRADLDVVREATGFAAGGTPPFGHARPIAVYADPSLRRHRQLWAAAGTPTTVFPLSLDELATASGARWADIAEGE